MEFFRKLSKGFKNRYRRSYQETFLKLKYYRKREIEPERDNPSIIFMIDGKVFHGGWVDRLKGIISTYAMAKKAGFRFRIFADESVFPIQQYLVPKSDNLYLRKGELSFSKRYAKPLYLINEFLKTDPSLLFNDKNMQYHVYANVDFLPLLNPERDKKHLHVLWSALFHELFTFPKILDSYIAGKCPQWENTTLGGIHLRFTSALGDFKDTAVRHLTESERQNLLNQSTKSIEKIVFQRSKQLYFVFSDSMRFLNSLKDYSRKMGWFDSLIFLDGRIGHIELESSEETLLKTVLDFYALTKCSEIYQLLGDNMYNSNFSRYASYLANCTFNLVRF